MRQVNKEFLEFAKKHRLLYDGGKAVPRNLNKLVNPFMGRTYVITKHRIFVTCGSKGIYDIVLRIQDRDRKLLMNKNNQRKR